MHDIATTVTPDHDVGERPLACNDALAEIDYLNFYMEQRVTACVRRIEQTCGDMLRSLASLDEPAVLPRKA